MQSQFSGLLNDWAKDADVMDDVIDWLPVPEDDELVSLAASLFDGEDFATEEGAVSHHSRPKSYDPPSQSANGGLYLAPPASPSCDTDVSSQGVESGRFPAPVPLAQVRSSGPPTRAKRGEP